MSNADKEIPVPDNTAAEMVENRVAELLFSLFLYVADANEGLTARDVQGLQGLVGDTHWCECAFLQPGLQKLRARYADLWKDYQKKAVARDLRTVAGNLAGVLGAPGAPPPGEIVAALRVFVERLCRNASPALARIGLGALPPAKQQARLEVESLFAQTAGEQQLPIAADPRAAGALAVQPVSVPEDGVTGLALWPAATIEYSPEFTWKRGRTAVSCVAVVAETHDVKTFVFQAVRPVLFAYKPGQFVTLELPIGGKTIRRSYTISSSPSRPHAISITVKRVPDGLVSNWLHENMREGFRFNLSGPNGDFTCFDAPAPKLLLIAAGSGITPVMSMLRWLADTSSPANIVFLNNIRTPADIIFAREFDHLGMRMGAQLNLGIVPGSAEPSHAWSGPVSHFTEDLLKDLAPDFMEREVFVCGPPGYMNLVRSTLERIGYPMQRYHQESFGAPPAERPGLPSAAAVAAAPAASVAPALSVPETTKVEIVFSKSAKTLYATSDDFILDLADENGVEIDSSCRAGNCGTCKVRITEGKVEMDGQQALSEADILDGYVLLCCGRATTPRVVLEA
jgi:ferredoxin-NADP reductase